MSNISHIISYRFTRLDIEQNNFLVCMIAALFMFYEFIQMSIPNSISNTLIVFYHIDASKFGILASSYFYANLVALLFAGTIIDKFSVKKVMIVSLSICIIGTILFSFAVDYKFGIMSRFLTGIGSGFCFLCYVKLASRFLQEHQMGMALGFGTVLCYFGGYVAQSPFYTLTTLTGWQNAILIDATVGLVLLTLIINYIKNYPDTYLDHKKSLNCDIESMSVYQQISKTFKNSNNWRLGLFTSCMNIPVLVLGTTWGGSYLVATYEFSPHLAAQITSCLFWGVIIGAPLVGYFTRHSNNIKKIFIIASCTNFILVTISTLHLFESVSFIMVTFFMIGLFASTQILSYPLITKLNPKSLTATANSIASLCFIGGPTIINTLYGYILDMRWDGTLLDGNKIYSIANHQSAISLILVTSLICIPIALSIKTGSHD